MPDRPFTVTQEQPLWPPRGQGEFNQPGIQIEPSARTSIAALITVSHRCRRPLTPTAE
jgi:hypothetical protein